MASFKWFLMFLVFLVLLVIDLLIPDPLPFVDEIILMILTALTGKNALFN